MRAIVACAYITDFGLGSFHRRNSGNGIDAVLTLLFLWGLSGAYPHQNA
jgi:hypothetical protein